MRIKKKETSVGILGKILNAFSNSNKDAYSADYINKTYGRGGVKDYSTKEVKLNEKWVDGKPIYRKVFVRSDLTGFNTGLSIDTLVHQEVLVSQNISTSDWRPIPWLFNNGANYGIASWCGGYYLRDNGSIAFQVGSELSKVKKCIIIFEYTKK